MGRSMTSGRRLLPFLLIALLGAVTTEETPQSVADELLAADRAFSAAAASRNVADALSAMFADDVVMPIPGSFARSKADAVKALNANPDNVAGRASWTPVRAGISADGRHGFTIGHMIVRRPDSTQVQAKYVAYWVKQPEGWRVAVYKRARGLAGAALELMKPSLPSKLAPVSSDAAAIAGFKASLDRAERGFSDDAQRIGLGPAFAKHGSPDATNVGAPTNPNFTVGAEQISREVAPGDPGPAKIFWGPVDVLVASSGDFGVTFGFIERSENAAQKNPYVTIWRRASAQDTWRYIAE
jgi:ketosteroid isomerase-like protein